MRMAEGLIPMTAQTIGRPMEILLVEDDLADAGLTIETLKESHVPCRVSLVRDGEEALEFLRRIGKYARAPRADLILLDMNLPKKDGREVLQEVRSDSQLGLIPVVVLTNSPAHRELLEEQGLRIEHFLPKPIDRMEFMRVVKALRKYLLADIVIPR